MNGLLRFAEDLENLLQSQKSINVEIVIEGDKEDNVVENESEEDIISNNVRNKAQKRTKWW